MILIQKDTIMKLKILGVILALFIAIQFIPYGKDHSNPTIINGLNGIARKPDLHFLHYAAIVIAMKQNGRPTAMLRLFPG